MIYFIQDTETRNVKIGYTERDVSKRLAELQTGSAHRLEVLYTFPHSTREMEQRFHKVLEKDRLQGEWFRPSLRTIFLIAGYRLIVQAKDPDVYQIAEDLDIDTEDLSHDFGLMTV